MSPDPDEEEVHLLHRDDQQHKLLLQRWPSRHSAKLQSAPLGFECTGRWSALIVLFSILLMMSSYALHWAMLSVDIERCLANHPVVSADSSSPPNQLLEMFARPPFDAVLDSLRCLDVSSGLLTDADLQRLNGPIYAEVDEQTKPKLCPWNGSMLEIYPIVFGLPAENLVSCPTVKHRDSAQVVAGRTDTYVFTASDEAEYIHSYRISRFAYTRSKAGWDCARHWEILSAGSVPFFDDIDNCPSHTLAHLPKSLIREARQFPSLKYDTSRSQLFINHTLFDNPIFGIAARYTELQQQLLHFARTRLTTEALVLDMLRRVGRNSASVRSAVVLGCANPHGPGDYMDLSQTHGWLHVLGDRVALPFPHPSLFRWSPPNETLAVSEATWKQQIGQVPYGLGFLFSRRLYRFRDALEGNFTYFGSSEGHDLLQSQLQAKAFDLIIYSCAHRNMPFADVVFKEYSREEIIVVDGYDRFTDTSGRRKEMAHKSLFFLREIPDDCAAI